MVIQAYQIINDIDTHTQIYIYIYILGITYFIVAKIYISTPSVVYVITALIYSRFSII